LHFLRPAATRTETEQNRGHGKERAMMAAAVKLPNG